ncbi:alpha/beta hydrolase [Streptomyces mirabilis]|uniref:hypothetical protein n=1 Tax=Streptomyces mirabilis TaxID=68239 RepID=UPI0036970BAB
MRRRPVDERLPVVVLSHGAHDHLADTTIVVQELASHGFVVVTVDHTYDAFSEFPDGRLTVPLDVPALGARDFATDILFVLDRVDDLAAGRNPDAEHRPLPAGLLGALDPRRVGMFGWSKGATATALVMSEDPRVRAGLSPDGPMEPTVTTDLDRPFMLMTAAFPRAEEPSVAEFWSHLRGWRLNVQADGAVHSSYGDYQVLIPQLAKAVGMSDEDLRSWIGTLAPARAARIQQALPARVLRPAPPATPGAPARRPECGIPRGHVHSMKRRTAALTPRDSPALTGLCAVGSSFAAVSRGRAPRWPGRARSRRAADGDRHAPCAGARGRGPPAVERSPAPSLD